MEIKVHCGCGQKYKFDVEPVDGRMPWEVNCPACGASGTDHANGIIAQAAAGPPPMAKPIPMAIPLTPVEPAAAVEAPRPRMVIRQHTPAAAPEAIAPAAVRPMPLRPAPAARGRASSSSNAMFFRGVLGAFIGALVGMGVWYGLVVATGYQIGIVAWGVGALTGLGARVLGRDGNTALGVVSALFAAVAILGGGTLAVHHMLVKELGGEFSHENLTHEMYVESLKEAQEAGSLETDAQIRAFLAKRDESAESDVTLEEIAFFKQDELPEMRELASGALTEQEYVARYQQEVSAAAGMVSAIGWVAAFIGSVFSLWTILWLFFGCASAYKIGADVSS